MDFQRYKRWELIILKTLDNEEYASKMYLRQRILGYRFSICFWDFRRMLIAWLTIREQKVFHHLPINVLPTNFSNRRSNTWGLIYKIISETKNEINETKALAPTKIQSSGFRQYL